MYEFAYTVTDADYLRFNRYFLTHNEKHKRLQRVVRFLPAISFLLLGLNALIKEDNLTLLITYAVFAVLWLLFYGKLILFFSMRVAKQHCASGKKPYSEAGSIVFGDESLTEKTANGETTHRYAALDRICVDEGNLYLFINSLQAFLLPASVFATPAEREELLSFLQSKGCRVE